MVNADGRKRHDQNINANELAKSKSDATSDETLSDLEENEADSNSTAAGLDPGPSPDGERRDQGRGPDVNSGFTRVV